jgi:hypothetical protein
LAFVFALLEPLLFCVTITDKPELIPVCCFLCTLETCFFLAFNTFSAGFFGWFLTVVPGGTSFFVLWTDITTESLLRGLETPPSLGESGGEAFGNLLSRVTEMTLLLEGLFTRLAGLSAGGRVTSSVR